MKTAFIPAARTPKIGLALLMLAFFSGDLFAHARWSSDGSTPGRNNRANLKQGPCGDAARTNNPAIFEAGSTVTLNWESTIYHRGYFIISFSPAGDENFEDYVLIENIPERSSGGPGAYSAEVTLPAEPCDDCTLQMIQVMLDRNPPTNYYSCADIQLTASTDPGDITAPAKITTLTAQGGAPSLKLTWQNPTEDFAGVLITRNVTEPASNTTQQDAPQTGIDYAVGDMLNTANVVYIGRSQEFAIADAEINEWFGIFSFDAAKNYSEGVYQQVVASSNNPPNISLQIEQIGYGDGEIYAADGDVIIQALITDIDSNDTHTLSWEPSENLSYTNNESQQLLFNPSELNGEVITLAATVTDNGEPPYSASIDTPLEILPYSRHQPTLVLYQNGIPATRINLDEGEAEVRIIFEGDAPANIDQWQANWQHNFATVNTGELVLSFEAETAENFDISVDISTPFGPAAETLSLTVTAYTPVRLGSLGGAFLLGLMIIGAARKRFLIGKIK